MKTGIKFDPAYVRRARNLRPFFAVCAKMVASSIIIATLLVGVGWRMQRDVMQRERLLTVSSEALSEDRVARIFLPKGYDERSGLKYPIMISFDGAGYRHSGAPALLVHILSSVGMIPKMIVVALPSGRTRGVDFRQQLPNPHSSRIHESEEGRAIAFSRFLDAELAPAIEAAFATSDCWVISGHSLAGLYVMDRYTEKTTRKYYGYFAYSPTFTHDLNIIDRMNRKPTEENSQFLYIISVGKTNRTGKRFNRSRRCCAMMIRAHQ